jgi:hypothetical protein
LTTIGAKTVDVHHTDTPPNIDGVIESVWFQADSVYGFVQHFPYEKKEPVDRTVVYLLQDSENLYVAFLCYAEQQKPVACLTADEDHVEISLDPFGSKTTGYYFLVYGSGIPDDGWLLNDGRWRDNSWDGVWFRAVKVHEDHYVVEMQIPYKTMRYKQGLRSWGVQFSRYHAANRETDYWTEVLQSEDDLISRWGTLEGVDAQVTGYHFELYPEGYVRRDDFTGADTEYKPRGSLNAKWDITSQTTLSATAYPDFAQIESDPFVLNLGRYPVYLGERRPFFLEGQDIFNTAHGGVFYSRRIGKSLNGDVVPIISGLKLTSKTSEWNVGILGAYTDEYTHGDSLIEPYRKFGVARIKRRVLTNSDIGVILSSAVVDRHEYNYAAGIDGVFRSGINMIDFQAAMSDLNGKKGWAFESYSDVQFPAFMIGGYAEFVHDSFDVSDIGYLPWAGNKEIEIWGGPYRDFPSGAISHAYAGPEVSFSQEPGDTNWSTVISLETELNMRNGWGCHSFSSVGRVYEADTNYLYRNIDFSLWGKVLGQFMNIWAGYWYGFNYARGFPAYTGSSSFTYNYSIIEQLSAGLNTNLWIEWDTSGTVLSMYQRVRPNVLFRFNADARVSLFSELVMLTPGTEYGKTELYSNRIGALFSWNFRPKSWIYLALNDYYAQEELGKVEHQYQIAAVKMKYLLYF